MQQFYNEKTLATSAPYKSFFNDDAFELFRIHYPEYFVMDSRGYRTIYKDKQRAEKSLFNKLGTNYSAYTTLVNTTIAEMINSGIIKDSSEANVLSNDGYNKVIDFLKSNKDFFAQILPELGTHIKRSSDKGDKSELGSEKILKKIFGEKAEIRNSAGLAQKSDTHEGKDRIVIKDGKSYNVQIKAVRGINSENGYYYIDYLGAKLYPNIDIMIFNRGPWYFAFRSKDENGIITVKVLGQREGYIVSDRYKILAYKLEA